MIRNKSSRVREINEDDSLLAGWMYADLFLALMVVFLATVTFIPEYIGRLDQTATNSAYNYQEIYKEPMLVVYEGFNADLIRRDVTAFLQAKKLSPESEIIYAQIVGPYDPKSETASDGVTRARKFSEKLDQATADLLKSASTTLSSTTTIALNRVAVKFTFATNVGVKR
jgi:hypothetical protein